MVEEISVRLRGKRAGVIRRLRLLWHHQRAQLHKHAFAAAIMGTAHSARDILMHRTRGTARRHTAAARTAACASSTALLPHTERRRHHGASARTHERKAALALLRHTCGPPRSAKIMRRHLAAIGTTASCSRRINIAISGITARRRHRTRRGAHDCRHQSASASIMASRALIISYRRAHARRREERGKITHLHAPSSSIIRRLLRRTVRDDGIFIGGTAHFELLHSWRRQRRPVATA